MKKSTNIFTQLRKILKRVVYVDDVYSYTLNKNVRNYDVRKFKIYKNCIYLNDLYLIIENL